MRLTSPTLVLSVNHSRVDGIPRHARSWIACRDLRAQARIFGLASKFNWPEVESDDGLNANGQLIQEKPAEPRNTMKAENIFIVHPKTNEEASALKAFMQALKIKFEVSKKGDYLPEFVAKVLKSEKQIAEGKSKKVKREELNDLLGL